MNLIAPEVAEIDIMSEIGLWGITAKDFADDLRGLGNVRDIRVNINSPGGDVFDGLAIYNLLKQHAASVTVNVIGMAASAASFIVCAGDKVLMPANAYLMTHDVRGGCFGTSAELKTTSDLVSKLTDSIAEIYAVKTGKDVRECRKIMSGEHWMSAKEALMFGFCDEVLEEQKLVACAQFSSKFSSLPVALMCANAEGVFEGAPSVATGGEDQNLPDGSVSREMEPTHQVEPLCDGGLATMSAGARPGMVGVSAADLTLLNAHLASVILERDEAVERLQSVEARVQAQVQDEMASLGVSASQLPSAVDAAVSAQLSMEEYLAGLAKMDDPRARSEYHNKNFDRIK